MSPPPKRDFIATETDAYAALRVIVRLDVRRAAAVVEIARMCNVHNPEIVRRMIDFWLEHHPVQAGATEGLI